MPFILGVILAVIILGGVVALGGLNQWEQAIADAFAAQGLTPAWGVALARVETGGHPATNDTGPDAARGGSYGPTQISERTARAYGYTGAMDDLNTDPQVAAMLTAGLVADGFSETSLSGPYVTRRYGRPASFNDMLSVWNSGRPLALTRTDPSYFTRGNAALAGLES